ncbi:hypothetical protein NC651_016682 [Populus alba x Populus x berolinensis]|nr:hypothetical protein NC651_016682 [Populus alba x Populus x berolinensis]
MGGKRKHCVCFRNAMLEAGPGATIGGMCATRCSGSIAVRYGTMRDNVISLKVVHPNGDVVKTASRARKSAAGEGILGVTMEVTLWPQKIPLHSVVTMYNFLTIKDAADVAIDTMLSGIQVSRVELLDEVQVRAVNIANENNLTELPTLIFEFICTGKHVFSYTEGGSMGLLSNETQQEAMISMIPGFGSFLFSPPVGSNWVEIGLEPTATQTLSVICSVLHDLCIKRLKSTLHTGPKYPSFFWLAS